MDLSMDTRIYVQYVGSFSASGSIACGKLVV